MGMGDKGLVAFQFCAEPELQAGCDCVFYCKIKRAFLLIMFTCLDCANGANCII
jgi:hypothetical protein